MRASSWERITEWNASWSLAVVFGLASIPWTYAFVAGLHVPLWPSFVASATYYAAGGGVNGLVRGSASNVVGIAYAAATIGLVNSVFGGGVIALSVVVGVFMFVASLHASVPVLSFAPGGFLGYASMFGVHAGGASAVGITGLPGETIATMASMLLGAVIGLAIDEVSSTLGDR